MLRHPSRQVNSSLEPFNGFALPKSNTTYTPNQFFDVCIPHCSRGAVRLVGYLIRKTLGWCDQHGRPQQERISVSFNELIREAGISRDMIKSVLAEATAGGFIRRVKEGRANHAGSPAVSAEYELAWDENDEYLKDPKRFRGFFAGEGNRTYIPNQFFDYLLPNETLAVTKVVASVIRFSIGFQTKWGHRRQQTALSYQTIQNYSKIRNRTTISEALAVALQRHYLQRIEHGFFDPNGGATSKAAVYALQWLNDKSDSSNGQKSVPEEQLTFLQSENQTGDGQKSVPAERSEIRTDIQIKRTNNTFKQQRPMAAATFEKLKAAGFSDSTAEAIADRYPAERIERQLAWIGARRVKSNRLGMLRKAIEQDWEAPAASKQRAENLRQRNFVAAGSGLTFEQALANTRTRFEGRSNS